MIFKQQAVGCKRRHVELDRRRFLTGLGGLAAVGWIGLDGSRHAEAVKVPGDAGWRLKTQAAAGLSASGRQYAVATVQAQASRAAAHVFQSGGNAVDAAVAASFMLSVVDPHNSGIGGGCFALIRSPDGQVHAIDGREQAGAAATSDMFLRDGRPQPELSQTGPLAAGVPGQVAALEAMWQKFGQQKWESLIEGATQVAEEGFVVGPLAGVIRAQAEKLARFPESKRVWLPDGRAPGPEDRLRQPDLARTLRGIAREGSGYFYRGPIAKQVAQHLAEVGGILTESDFADYRPRWREPLETWYRGRRVLGFPPPSSGGIHVAQMLGMLETYDLAAVFHREPALLYHLWLEVMKRAMADRAKWLGDADHVQVPRGLVDPTYLLGLAEQIRLGEAQAVDGAGMPPAAESQFFGDKHTTHLTTADGQGWVVAMTQTINTSFGSKLTVPGTGIVLNNEMDDFSIAPGVANAFGLVGSQANAVAPGKRPLSSMSPTLVVDAANQPVLTCGAAGGPRIITATLQNICRVLDLEQTIEQALAAPRVHHQWVPDKALVEQRMPPEVVAGLRRRGHDVEVISASATAQGIQWLADQPQPTLLAAADPRSSGGLAWAE